jgi:hypothetical protein
LRLRQRAVRIDDRTGIDNERQPLAAHLSARAIH